MNNYFRLKILTKLITTIAIWFIAPPLKSEPSLKIDYKFYDIHPVEPQELYREMHQQSPIIYNGKKFVGFTNWRVTWKYSWQTRNEQCQIKTVSTDLQVVYTMPRIHSSHSVTPQVRQKFDRYYADLLQHEKGHKDSGLYAAREIEQSLLDMQPLKSCKRLSQSANYRAEQIIKKYNQRDLNYDRLTEHGKLQNVNLDSLAK